MHLRKIAFLFLLMIVAGMSSGCATSTSEDTGNVDSTTEASAWTTYANEDLAFEISTPSNATVKSYGVDTQTNGRVGAIDIKNDAYEVSISVYTDMTNLEKDFSGGGDTTTASTMASLGLEQTTLTWNGKESMVYYGDHIADAPGGGDSTPYVAIEVEGPTYAYMFQFYGISDPNNETVAQYMNSFVAR